MKAPLRLRRPQVFRIFVHQEHERYVDQGDARMEMGTSAAGEPGAGFCGYGIWQGNAFAFAGGMLPRRRSNRVPEIRNLLPWMRWTRSSGTDRWCA